MTALNDRQISATREAWSAIEPETRAMFRTLWETPELPMMEYEAEAALSSWLSDHGFTVERGVCRMPTAFRAVWSNGDGPTLGFLAEYDALPGQGNRLEPNRAPDGKRGGHACGHNLIGGADSGAAIAAKAAMEELGLTGSIVVLGTPAEEILWGKIAMLRDGAFDGIDALLTSHGDYQNGAPSRPCLSCVSAEFVFSGVSSHGGSRRSQNALDAAELMVQSVERLRAHQFSNAIIGHVLRFAGYMPSITPDEARLWITVRHEVFEHAEEVYNLILPIAADAAGYTGTEFREQLISASRGYLANDVMANRLHDSMQIIGPPAWDDDDLSFMRDLSEHCRPGQEFVLDRDVAVHTEGCDPYGQDDGEASFYIPLARANWAYPTGVLLHNWAATANSGHESQFKGGVFAGESLALTAIDLVSDPAAIDAAQKELVGRVGTRKLSPPRVGGFDVMTQNPESFWDSTWVSHDRLSS
ncbi:MAG: amidohydrolase [Rhodospirillaceae bacterium]|nr:amidohydrolase [Rhodospirillaceae bacterium]